MRAQLTRFRGREVNTSGDGFLAMFDGPQRAIRCARICITAEHDQPSCAGRMCRREERSRRKRAVDRPTPEWTTVPPGPRSGPGTFLARQFGRESDPPPGAFTVNTANTMSITTAGTALMALSLTRICAPTATTK